MTKPDPHWQLELLLLRVLTQGKGEHVAMLLRAMGQERINWKTARKPIGAASTWLVTFDTNFPGHHLNAQNFITNIVKYIHAAGFTSEELIAPLTLLE